jgi:hypothetical protein
MPNIWLDDEEALDLFGDASAEDYFDGDAEDVDFESYGDDGEATTVRRDHRAAQARRAGRDRDLARRRALARRLLARRAALARARRRGVAPTRPRYPATGRAQVGPTMAAAEEPGLEGEVQDAQVRQTRAAVRELGLETQVQADAVADALAAQARRIDSTGAALGATAVANTVASQLQTSFPGVARNPFVRAGLPLAPLLLLKPARRESGFQGFIADPRVWAGALVAGLAIAGEINNKVQKPEAVRITRFATHLPMTGHLQFFAEALDAGGAVLRGKQINWREETPAKGLVRVDRDGLVTGVGVGTTAVVAEADGTTVSDSVPVTVV